MRTTEVPDWVVYPEDDWETITPEEAGLDREKFDRFLGGLDARGAAYGGEDHTGDKWGTVLTRGGYLVHTWGDGNYKFQTASSGKTFGRVLVGLAVQEGLIEPDDLITDTWTGEGQLSHPHKHLDQGHHKMLTWRHHVGDKYGRTQYAGFPVAIGGSFWEKGRAALSKELADKTRSQWPSANPKQSMPPEWANWTGDPFYDNYAHVEPGTIGHYASGGFWRLSQALTALWNRDLKDVLDEKIMSKIGIPADRWDWLPGGVVQQAENFPGRIPHVYPLWPSMFNYLDPPFEINGHVVRSGPGWVVITPLDFARFGHLVATRGNWKGEQLLDPQWLRGHGGGNGSGVCGESRYYTAMGKVSTEGIAPDWNSTVRESFVPRDVFVGPVKLTRTV